jgi:hypothetical protein
MKNVNNVDEQELKAVMNELVKDLNTMFKPEEVKHGWKSWKDKSTGLILSEWV